MLTDRWAPFGGVFITNAGSRDIEDARFAGAGFGCGSGPRGIRGAVTFDGRAERDLKGVLAAPLAGTLPTSIRTSTTMCNAYYDLGHWGSFVCPISQPVSGWLATKWRV